MTFYVRQIGTLMGVQRETHLDIQSQRLLPGNLLFIDSLNLYCPTMCQALCWEQREKGNLVPSFRGIRYKNISLGSLYMPRVSGVCI